MSRVLNVVRLQFINKQTFIWVPLMILGSVLAFSLVLFAVIPSDQVIYSGAGQAVMWYFFAIGITSMSFTFPFSQALSITRQDFFLGTFLSALLASAVLAALTTVLGVVEVATDGWGMNGRLFAPDWLWNEGPLFVALFSFVVPMFLFTLGFLSTVVYRTWGPMIFTTLAIALGLLIVAAVFIISTLKLWAQVGQFFVSIGVLGAMLIAFAVAAAFAGLAFLALRRATP